MSASTYTSVMIQTFGGLLSLLMMIFLFCLKRKKSSLLIKYLHFLFINTLLLFFNAIVRVIDGMPGQFWRVMIVSSNFILFLLSYATMPVFAQYLANYINEKGGNFGNYTKYIWILCFLSFTTVVISQFNGMYYYIDLNNNYIHGSYFWLSQVLGIVTMLIILFKLTQNRKFLGKIEFYSFFAYVALPTIGLILQIFIYSTAIVYFSGTLMAVSIYVFIQAEQESNLYKKELELERSRMSIMLYQIQPHFLYNTLASISSLCDTDPERASAAISDFSSFLRCNIDSMGNGSLIPFNKELEHVNHYLAIEKLRYGKRLTVNTDIQAEGVSLPPLTLQPLVENAIRHGIGRKLEGGTVTITTHIIDNDFVLQVTDDGVGFDPSAINPSDSNHIGLQNVRTRLTTECNGKLEIISKVGSGTIITVTIPVNSDRLKQDSKEK